VSAEGQLAELLASRRVLLCVGAGGVGKTTVSAALGAAAAMAGQKVAVVTIDPARRLADAMGLDGLSNAPRPVAGDWSGELWAIMLDTRAMFDELVTRYARSDNQATRILNNRYYQNIISALAGSTEFMAVEKLYDLAADDYDLIIVDTPPSNNSLEFVARPERLHNFMTSRLRWVISPPGVFKPAAAAIAMFLRQAAKVVGQTVIDDSVAFLQAFDGMEEDFGARAGDVAKLLKSPETGFVLVTSARPEPAREASRLGAALRETKHTVDGVIFNRLTPDLGVAPDDVNLRFGSVARNLLDHQQRVAWERGVIQAATAEIDAPIVHHLTQEDAPVSDMAGIGALAAQIHPG